MGRERSVLFCILDESIPVLETVWSAQRIVVGPTRYWPLATHRAWAAYMESPVSCGCTMMPVGLR